MPVITSGLTITSSYGSWYFDELPIKADQASVDQFCVEKGYGSVSSFVGDGGGFSNDGARLMNYYTLVITGGTTGEYYWVNLYGYDGIVTSITT